MGLKEERETNINHTEISTITTLAAKKVLPGSRVDKQCTPTLFVPYQRVRITMEFMEIVGFDHSIHPDKLQKAKTRLQMDLHCLAWPCLCHLTKQRKRAKSNRQLHKPTARVAVLLIYDVINCSLYSGTESIVTRHSFSPPLNIWERDYICWLERNFLLTPYTFIN